MLTKQSSKASKLSPVICFTRNHRTVTACRSDSDPATNYQQTIEPTHKEFVDGHKVVVYKVTCAKVVASSPTGVEPCQGNGHAKEICKHSLAGIRAAVKAQGKKLYTMSSFDLALKRKGVLIKIVGEHGFCYGVVTE